MQPLTPQRIPLPSVLPPQVSERVHLSIPSYGEYTPSSRDREIHLSPFSCAVILPRDGMVLDAMGVYHNYQSLLDAGTVINDSYWVVPRSLMAASDGEIKKILSKGVLRQPAAQIKLKEVTQGFEATYSGLEDESFPAYIDAVVTHVSNANIPPSMVVHVIATGLRGAAQRSFKSWSTGLNRTGFVLSQLPPNHVVAALTLSFWHKTVQNSHIAHLQRSLKQGPTEDNREFLHRFSQETCGLHMSDAEMINMMREAVDSTRFQLPFPSQSDISFNEFMDLMDRSAVSVLNGATRHKVSVQSNPQMARPLNPLQVNAISGHQPMDVRAELESFKSEMMQAMQPVLSHIKQTNQPPRTTTTSGSQPHGVNESTVNGSVCQYCNRIGHVAANCFKLRQDADSGVLKLGSKKKGKSGGEKAAGPKSEPVVSSESAAKKKSVIVGKARLPFIIISVKLQRLFLFDLMSWTFLKHRLGPLMFWKAMTRCCIT